MAVFGEKNDAPVDLLFLQETKTPDADFPVEAFKAMGYIPYFCGEKSYNGVAVLARFPIEVTFGFQDGEVPDFPTRVAYAKTPQIAVLNTYVPQGKEIIHPHYEMKKHFLDRVRNFLDREIKPNMPFAWVGDLNVAPLEIDVPNPQNKNNHVCFHQEIRDKFNWVISWGLFDVFRSFHPEKGAYSFFDYRVRGALSRNIGWRIDHIFANKTLAKKAFSSFIDKTPRGWERPSDHVPLVADFIF